ncbi:MAG: hypothetical protein WBA74_19220 [Cyclobacteriaceae bacterium]
MQVEVIPQESNTKALLQAISVIDDNTIWVSGHQGIFTYTKDGGITWETNTMPDADTLQFRDVHAFSPKEVLLMSAGKGKLSQIRKTIDGGKSWNIVYQMKDTAGFLNTIEFWDDRQGLAFGDAIDGQLFLLRTDNGGDSWERVNPESLPSALGSEGGFAASGTCIATGENGKAWVATGAGERPRIIYTTDYGINWQQSATPIISGEAAGITSVSFWNDEYGFIAGGDLAISNDYTPNTAFTTSGGQTWSLATHPVLKGAVYGTATTNYHDTKLVFVCGPNGIDYSEDLGTTWISLDTANYWAIRFTTDGTGWATGKNGKILKISLN